MSKDSDLVRASDHMRVLRRRWRLITVMTLLGGSAGFGLSLTQATAYDAEAKVLVSSPAADPRTGASEDQVATEAEFILSDALVAEVATTLRSSITPDDLVNDVTVEASTGTSVLVISARQPTAVAAAALANALAEEYVRFRASQSDAARTFLRGQISDLNQQIDAIQEELPALDRGNRAVALGDLTDLSARRSELEGRLMAQTVDGAQSAGRVLNAATAPAEPSQPRVPFDVGLGVAIGLILGLLAAYLREGGVGSRSDPPYQAKRAITRS